MDIGLDVEQNLDSFDDEEFVWLRLNPEERIRAREIHGQQREEFLQFFNGKRVTITEKQEVLLQALQAKLPEILAQYVPDVPSLRKNLPEVIFLERADYKDVRANENEKRINPDSLGFYSPADNTVVIWYKKSVWHGNQRNEEFIHTVAHELLHAYGIRQLQAHYKKEKDTNVLKIEEHRSGMHIWKLGDPKTERFWAINEAITEDLATEVTNVVINECQSEFRRGIMKQIEVIASRMRDSIVKTRAVELGFRENRTQAIEQMIAEGYTYEYPQVFQSYPKERKLLAQVITALCNRNPEYREKENGVRRLFYEAAFSGSMIKLGRLIDTTLGKGTFRLLAEKPFEKETVDRVTPVSARSPQKRAFLDEHEKELRARGLTARDISDLMKGEGWRERLEQQLHQPERNTFCNRTVPMY